MGIPGQFASVTGDEGISCSKGTTRNFVSTFGDITFVATFTDGAWALYALFFS